MYPAIGACITSQIFTLDGRLKALGALAALREVPEVLAKRINMFGERVRRPLELRNRVMHDQWFQGIRTQAMSQLEIGAKGSLTFGFKPVPIETLQEHREKVRIAMREACAIRECYRGCASHIARNTPERAPSHSSSGPGPCPNSIH